MNDDLPRVQKNYLEHISAHITEHGYSPTIAELAINFNVSKNAAYCVVKMLKQKKLITWSPRSARTIQVLE